MWSRRPFAIVLSAPSGTGKTTICREVVKRDKDVVYSVSVTTRPRRAGEVDGVDYFFIEEEEFLEKVKRKEFIEYAEVFGYYYGTPVSNVREAFDSSKDIIMDLDINGALNIKRLFPEDSVTIFLLPPNLKELERRLISRKRDPQRDMENRLERALKEVEFYKYYDYLIINDELEKAVSQVISIIDVERLKISRIKEVKWIKQSQ